MRRWVAVFGLPDITLKRSAADSGLRNSIQCINVGKAHSTGYQTIIGGE
ncbi:hypothetical protein GGD41_005503 [Paraburkholderia bryophila]|uniref:Uncharacterized protein n=1 Tax=Paraburkholderia bryophila TaxID=420952 RepID=A0A7Y9WKJ6_9BURK|nr:hypothetical protein [Paraburkholderia bryophila]NYH22630.1 hypothetical protein [Paraburkholderia bryophila]